ncbi:hypothetical protein C0J52_09979 [Blattella germanica]|nr:hypothetical protein C0J52_09979 [Blattella germanica]
MENSYVTFSEKGKPLIVVDGFKFCFKKGLKNGIQRWSCCKKSCHAYMKLDKENSVVESAHEHSHEREDDAALRRQKIRNESKVSGANCRLHFS